MRRHSPQDLDALERTYSRFDLLDADRQAAWRAHFFTQRQVATRAGFATQQSANILISPITHVVPCPFPDGLAAPPGLGGAAPSPDDAGDDGPVLVAMAASYPGVWLFSTLLYLTWAAELGIIIDPPSNDREAMARREGDTFVFALRRGRVVGLLALEWTVPGAILLGMTDGRTLDRAASYLSPYTLPDKMPVITLAWVAPNSRRKGVGTLLIRAACRLLGVRPNQVPYQLPFSPGGLALVYRVAGRRFRGAAAQCLATCQPLDHLEGLPPPDRIDEIDLTADQLRTLTIAAGEPSRSGPPPAGPPTPAAPRPRRRAAARSARRR